MLRITNMSPISPGIGYDVKFNKCAFYDYLRFRFLFRNTKITILFFKYGDEK